VTVLSIPLDRLRHARVSARFNSRVASLQRLYASGRHPPPIPVTYARDGTLQLSRDGNHRLAAARAEGVAHVWVRIDRRTAYRLR